MTSFFHEGMKEEVLSLIIEEMRTNECDSVNIICKDGESVKVSGLLLASCSYYVAGLFRFVDVQDCTVVLPDVEKSTFIYFIENVLLNKNPETPDAKVLSALNGVLWKEGFLEKKPDFSDYKGHLNQNPAFRESWVQQQYSTNEVKEELMDTCEVFAEDSIYFTDQDFNGDSDYTENKQSKIKSEKSSPKKKRKSRSPKKLKEEYIDDKNDVKKAKLSIKRKIRSEGPLYPQQALRLAPVSVLPDQLRDEVFNAAQDALRIDLENPYNTEDPKKLWYLHHGFNPDMFLLKSLDKEPKLICPICMLQFTQSVNGKSYFYHLRNHKIKNYQCDCKLQGRKTKVHLYESHWNWKKCCYCSELVKQTEMIFHLYTSHKEQASLMLKCPTCSIVVKERGKTASTLHAFKCHLDDHLKPEPFCKLCNMHYQSRQHKEFHYQVVHLKASLGCMVTNCYYTCDTEPELSIHKDLKHPNIRKRKEEEIVCALCGFTCNNAGTMATHKRASHDSNLLQCPQCPKQFNNYALNKHIKKFHAALQICNICGIKVKHLKDHLRVVHKEGAELNFKCQYCQKGFMNRAKVARHIKSVHTPKDS